MCAGCSAVSDMDNTLWMWGDWIALSAVRSDEAVSGDSEGVCRVDGSVWRCFACVFVCEKRGGFTLANEYSAQHHASPSVSHLRACGLGLEPNIDQQVWSLAADAWIPLIWCLFLCWIFVPGVATSSWRPSRCESHASPLPVARLAAARRALRC